MLLIEVEALENGAHRNQRSETPFTVIPEGMLPVAEELEEEAWGYLPFINITEVTDGVITGVEQGTIPEPDPEELAAQARSQRDALLAETDWTQVLDAPIDTESQAAYRTYRQALRDVPEQAGFPESIDWPEEPATVKAAPDPVDEAVDILLGGEADA